MRASAGGVGDVSRVVDPVGDLSLDGFGEHLTGPLTKDLAEDIAALK